MRGHHNDWSQADVVGHLRASPMFGRLDEDVVDRIAGCASMEMVEAGRCLIVEGEEGEHAFVVVAGRFEVVASNGPRRIVVNTLGPGDVFGEMALITDRPRSASVCALRDAAVIRIPSDEFRAILADNPATMLDVARSVMERLEKAIHAQRPEHSVSVVAVLPAGSKPEHESFAGALMEAAKGASAQIVTAADVLEHVGENASADAVVQHLHRVEDEVDLLVLVGKVDDPEWTSRCLRQSDVAVLVGAVDGLNVVGSGEPTSRDADRRTPRHLVIVHPPGSHGMPRNARTIRTVDRHHHVRLGSEPDVSRVLRIVTGRSIGVVFGGGGARGLAHLGALSALADAGVPIDHVGGSSMGAVAAGAVAMGWSVEEADDRLRSLVVGHGSLVDATIPIAALGRGKKLRNVLRAGFGDTMVEDLWTEFFCVSTDLTDGGSRVHTSGQLWTALRASIAIPGVFPPVGAPDGHVLVDGGILDNLPVGVMRDTFAPATVVAVDLRAPTSLPATDLSSDGDVSGWALAAGTLLPWKDRLVVPRIVDTLLAASMVTEHVHGRSADVVIRPDVASFGILDFTRADEIIAAGSRAAVEALSALDGPVLGSL